MKIDHEPYENEESTNFCVECNKEIDPDMFYCDKCFDELEKQGFFEIDGYLE